MKGKCERVAETYYWAPADKKNKTKKKSEAKSNWSMFSSARRPKLCAGAKGTMGIFHWKIAVFADIMKDGD